MFLFVPFFGSLNIAAATTKYYVDFSIFCVNLRCMVVGVVVEDTRVCVPLSNENTFFFYVSWFTFFWVLGLMNLYHI